MERVPIESRRYTGPKRTLSLELLEPRLLLQADWTVMVYLNGDSSGEEDAINNFLEMAHVGSTADVNIVAQLDRTPQDQSSGTGYTDSYGDWSGTHRGLVAKDDVPNGAWGTSLGEVDMGDPNALQDFLTWAVSNYPADHYAAILYDSGSGYTGVSFDETDGDYLTMSELSSAMSGALAATSLASFDLLDFDTSLMGMAEVAYQVKDVAGILIGSEDLTPSAGMPYDQVLGDLTDMPLMAPVELANDIAQTNLTYYSFTGTYSVVDLTQMGPLAAALSNFATTFINDGNGTDRNQLSQHWLTVPWYAFGDYLDIGVLMTDISGDNLMTGSIRNAADDVLGVYSDAIIGNYGGSWSFGGTGLSIYLPDDVGTVDADYNAIELSFAGATQWDEFLLWWTGVPLASWTYLIYMGADTNLEGQGLDDFLEMASIGSTNAVNIVVQLDRSTFYDTSYDDWTDTRRGLVNFGDVPDSTWGTSIGEADMGDPDTLADFVNWGMAMYPAQHYALTLWDHGDGLVGAIFDDDNGSGVMDNLTVDEMDQALQAVPTKLDVLDFTACDMGLLEVAYQIRLEASYMVASEDLYWGVAGLGGFSPWDLIFAHLTADPAMSPLEVADLTASEYFTSWSIGNLTVGKSVVDLSRVGALADSVDDLAQAALDFGTTEDRILMDQYRTRSPLYPNPAYAGGNIYRDLGTWLAGVAGDENISTAVSNAASAALTDYYSAVVANYAAPGTGTGLAIYMPGTQPAGFYSWQNISFAGDTQWGSFLSWWAANEVNPIAVYQSGAAKVTFFDMQGIQDIDPSDLMVKMSGTNVKCIILAGSNPMQGLGIVISGATSVGKIQDKRTNPANIAFIASNAAAKKVDISSPIDGEWLNGRSLGGVIFPSDIDGDGNPWDTTSLYFGGGVGKLSLDGTVYGGGLIKGPVKAFQLNYGDLMDDFLILGDAGKIQFNGVGWGWIWNRFYIDGSVSKLDMPDGEILPGAILDITGMLKKADIGYIEAGYVDISTPIDDDTIATVPLMSFDPSTVSFFYGNGATLQVGQGIGKMNVGWFVPGSVNYVMSSGSGTNSYVAPTDGTDQRYFIQYLMSNVLTPSIDRLDVEWGVANARILAGADLGADLLPGGYGANADTYNVGYIGQVRIGTVASKAGLHSEFFITGGPDATEYDGGTVADSLIAAGAFSANVPGYGPTGGSGYNLVSLHDNYTFEDGSYIGKVDVVGQITSLYNELEAAGDDFSTGNPPDVPFFVPFGIGSYAMGSVTIGGAAVSPVATYSSFGVWPRHSFLFVEVPRGLGFNA